MCCFSGRFTCGGGAEDGNLQPALPLRPASVTDWSCSLCVPGDSAVWPPAQRAAETVSAALPLLQPAAPGPSAVPLPHLRLLQQLPEQDHPAAGDELHTAGYIHPGKHRAVVRLSRFTKTVTPALCRKEL